MLDGPGDLLSVPVEGEPGLFVSMGKIKRYTKNCVRLDEKDAIARRQKEISALRKVTDELEDLAGELMRGEDGGPKEAETSAPEAVSYTHLETGGKAKLLRIGIDDQYCTRVGNQKYLRREYGLDTKGIIYRIKGTINESK